MSTNNNFKQLEEEMLKEQPHAPLHIGRNVDGNIKVFQMVGDMIELYMPRVFEMLVSLVGGEPEGRPRPSKDNEDYPIENKND